MNFDHAVQRAFVAEVTTAVRDLGGELNSRQVKALITVVVRHLGHLQEQIDELHERLDDKETDDR